MTTTLWLIRHGESEANVGKATETPDGIVLTQTGIEQAVRVVRAIPRTPSLIVTSPYMRARQSAEPTISHYPDVLVETWQVEEYTFLAPGKHRNTTPEQRRPYADAYWERNNPDYVDGEGAESYNAFLKRARTMIERAREYEFVVVFTHEMFSQVVLWSLVGSGMRGFQQFHHSFKIPNTAIIPLRIEADAVWTGGVYTRHL